MILENAIILDAGFGKELVGRSENVDQGLTEQLLPWAPALGDLAGGANESLSYFWLGGARCRNRLVFCRTVMANQPTEFGLRQGTLSRMVLIESDVLAGYQNNPALFAFHLRLEGFLYLPTDPKDWSNGMAPLDMFESTMSDLAGFDPIVAAVEAAQVRRAMEIHGRVAVTNVGDGLRYLVGLLDRWEPELRLATRFSVGSMVSDSRPHELLVYPEITDQIKRKLVNSQIRTIGAGVLKPMHHQSE